MKLRLILPLAIAALAVAGCNTTKTDQRADSGSTAGTTPSGSTGGALGGGAPLAAPRVGSVGSVSENSDKAVAADFGWTDVSGDHKLSDYRGKVVFINFWGTWCPPCRRELPSLIKLREEFGQEKFEIIGINVGEQPRDGSSVEAHVAKFATANKIMYPLVIGDEALVNAYGGIQVVPTTFVVDGTGRIVERIEGSRDEAGFRALIEKAM